ncbi:MAG: SAM-dependent methyltransferase [Planctomycetota bacterium]
MLKETLTKLAINAIERGWVPEHLERAGIRALLRQRLAGLNRGTPDEKQQRTVDFLLQSEAAPLAPLSEKANEQHYEVPTAFYELVLGPHKKYSSCHFESFADELASGERSALAITCQRAELENGQDILELGCGWGSLTLWMAEHYPASRITAVSNSRTQREFILDQARRRGIDGQLEVITCDMNRLELDRQFDRVVSVEMFEHMRNHRELLRRVSTWMRPEAKLFIHIFCHREFAYPFETDGAANWMGKYFFSGGMMPNEQLFSRYDQYLAVRRQWRWDGRHYERTSNLWLQNMYQHQREIIALFEQTYGPGEGSRWFHRWRMFFLACAELFGFRKGEEWFVAHYLLTKVPVAAEVDSGDRASRLRQRSS